MSLHFQNQELASGMEYRQQNYNKLFPCYFPGIVSKTNLFHGFSKH